MFHRAFDLKIFLFLLYFLLKLQYLQSRILWKMNRFECIVIDKSYVRLDLCEMKAINRSLMQISFKTHLFNKEPIDNITIHFGFRKRHQQKPVIEVTIDGCAFWRNKRRNPMANYMYNFLDFGKFSNMNHSCPYDHDIIVTKYEITQEKFRLVPVPDGHYTLYSSWSSYNILRMNVSAAFQKITI